MSNKKILFIIFLSIITKSALSYAATAWVAGAGEYFFAAGHSHTTSFSRDIIKESYKYRYLEEIIRKLEEKIEKTRAKFELPQYVRKQRIEIIQEKINSLKNRQNKLKKNFERSSSHVYLERGLNENYSLGLDGNLGLTEDFNNKKSNFSNLTIFAKRKIYQDKKWMISGEGGLNIEDAYSKYILPVARINMAYIKEYKSGRKLISSFSFSTGIDKVLNYIGAEACETLEFPSGYLISLSSYYQYKKHYNFGYKYYYKDQFIIAKKIQADRISPLKDATLSLGLYKDYFYKSRKHGSKGIYCGVWLRF